MDGIINVDVNSGEVTTPYISSHNYFEGVFDEVEQQQQEATARRKLAAMRSMYISEKTPEQKELENEFQELNYLKDPRARANERDFHMLMGNKIANDFAGGDVWSALNKSIEELPEAQRAEYLAKRDGCAEKIDGLVLLSKIQERLATNWTEKRREEQIEIQNLPDDFRRELPAYIAGGDFSPAFIGKLDKYKKLDELKPTLARARNAYNSILNMQHGGNKEEYEKAVKAEYEKLKADPSYINKLLGGAETDEELMQQARANISETYEVSREQMREFADLLTDENGKIDMSALAGVVMALDADAQGQQTIDQKFLRNMVYGMIRWAKEADDYSRKYMSGVASATYSGDEGLSFLARKTHSASTPDWQKEKIEPVEIDPRVEIIKSQLSKLEDRRLSPSEKASMLSGIITELGSTFGENIPFLATSSLGTGGLLAGSAAMFPHMANREIADAYAAGEVHPELVGNIKGIAQAGAEGLFGRAIGGNKYVGRVLDRVGAKTMSIPGAGKAIATMQGNTLLRMAANVAEESIGELFVEDIVADGVSCLTLNGLNKLGFDITEQDFATFEDRWKAFEGNPHQSAATVAYCAIMGLFGWGGTAQQARAFAQNVDDLAAAGIKLEHARELATLANSENVDGKKLIDDAREYYVQDVLTEDPIKLKKRLEEQGKKFMEDVEVAALARGGVRDYILKEAGVIESEAGDDGLYNIKQVVKNENGEEEEIKTQWTEEQLDAWLSMRHDDMVVKAMREFQARMQGQALASAEQTDSERVKGEIFSLQDLPTAAAAVMKRNGGKIDYEVLSALADEARNTIEGFVDAGVERGEAEARQSVVPNVSLGALARAAESFSSRVASASETAEGKALGVKGVEDAETAIFRLPAMSPGQSVLLYNSGVVSEREVVEDLLERDLIAAMQEPGALKNIGALLREVENSLKAYNKNIQLLPEKENINSQDVIEAFSTLAQSRFLLNHASYNMPQAAHDSIEYVQKKLDDARHLITISDAWDAFSKSKEGKKFIENEGASLEKLLENAGASVAGRYAHAKLSAEVFEAVRSAYESATSLAAVEEMLEEYEEEQANIDSAPPPEMPEAIAAEDSITGEEVTPEEQIDSLFASDTGELSPAFKAEDGERGRGLVGEKYLEAEDGSIYGAAEVSSIHLSPDVPQFKKKASPVGRVAANEDGTTRELSGEWNAKADPIIVWRRTNGRLEVISGRHRLAHAKKNGLKNIAVRLYDEDQTHDARWAKLYDVESNILANTCNAIDIAYFFRNEKMPIAEAERRGLIPKTIEGEQTAASKIGIEIANKASDETFSALINGAFSVEDVYRAVSISESPDGQALALRERSKKNKPSWDYITALVRGAEQTNDGGGALLDLFGFDEAFTASAEKMAKYVESARLKIKERMNILQRAMLLARKGEKAEREGVKVKTPEDALKKIKDLAALDAAYERLDVDLCIPKKAEEWDGMSAVAIDERGERAADAAGDGDAKPKKRALSEKKMRSTLSAAAGTIGGVSKKERKIFRHVLHEKGAYGEAFVGFDNAHIMAIENEKKKYSDESQELLNSDGTISQDEAEIPKWRRFFYDEDSMKAEAKILDMKKILHFDKLKYSKKQYLAYETENEELHVFDLRYFKRFIKAMEHIGRVVDIEPEVKLRIGEKSPDVMIIEAQAGEWRISYLLMPMLYEEKVHTPDNIHNIDEFIINNNNDAGGNSFSLRARGGVLAEYNLRELAEEQQATRLINRARRVANRFRKVFEGDNTRTAEAARTLGEASGIIEAVLEYLPKNERPRFDQQIKQIDGLARMIERGRISKYGTFTSAEKEEMKSLVSEKMTEGKIARKRKKDIVKDIASERVQDIIAGMLDDAAAAMEKHIVSQEVARIERIAEKAQPKKMKNGKFAKGKMSAESLRELNRLMGLVNMSAEEKQKQIESLSAAIEADEQAGEDTTEKLEALKEVMTFGALRGADLKTARTAVARLVQFVKTEKATWGEAIELEKKRLKYIAERAAAELGGAREDLLAAEKSKSGMLSEIGESLLVGFQSLSQILYGMQGIDALKKYASKSLDDFALGNNLLFVREKQMHEREKRFMQDVLWLKNERARNNFIVDLKKLRDSKVQKAGEMKSRKIKLSVEEAREVAKMDKDALEKRNNKIISESEQKEIFAENILSEKDQKAIRRALEEAGENPQRKYITIESTFRTKPNESTMRMTKDEALNVILLCEQEDYAEQAADYGFTPEVIQKLKEFVGDKALAYGYFMREALESNGLADVYEAREGVPFPRVKNYWPGRFDQSGRAKEEKNALDQTAGKGTSYGMLIQRVKHKLRFDLSIGATNSFRAALAQQNNYICMGEFTSGWRKLLAHKDFATALQTKIGVPRFQTFKQLLDLVDGMGTSAALVEQATSSLLGKMQSAHAPAVLSGGVYTLIKQCSAILNGAVWGDVPLHSLMREMFTPGAASLKDIANLESMKVRDEDSEEFARLQTQGRNASWSRAGWLSRWGTGLIGKMDVASNVVGMRALYNATYRRISNAQKGAVDALSDAEIRRECERVVRNALELGAQPMRATQKASSLALSRGAVMRIMGYMGSETFNKVGAAVAIYNRAGGGVKGFKKAMKYIVTLSSGMQLAMMTVQMLQGSSPADTDEEWEAWLLSNALTGITGAALLQGVPVVGELIAEVTGDYVKTGTYAEALYDVKGAKRTVKKLFGAVAEDKKMSDADLAWNIVSALRYAAFATGITGSMSSRGIGASGKGASWLSEAAGMLQSAVTATSATVRPIAQRERNIAREEKASKKK